VKRIEHTTPLVLDNVLASLSVMTDNELMKHQKQVGPVLIELSGCDNHQVRAANKVLLQRIFRLLNSQLPE
jgi:hypothetical protein